jgi:hypothetical protein
MVAGEFEGVAPFDQADALIDQALEELALDAVELAVEQVDERPQQIGEIVLDAGAGQHGAQRFDRIVELGLHGDPLAGGADGLHPQGRSRAEDGAGQPFCFALQSRPLGRRRKIVGRRHCNPASSPANRRSGRPLRGSFPAEAHPRRKRKALLPSGAAPINRNDGGTHRQGSERRALGRKRVRSEGTI